MEAKQNKVKQQWSLKFKMVSTLEEVTSPFILTLFIQMDEIISSNLTIIWLLQIPNKIVDVKVLWRLCIIKL